MSIMNLIIAVAVLIIAWMIIERFSPDPLITKIAQIGIFVVALLLVLKLLLPLAGVSF
jgi:uncharacterized membrane protein